jgi:hypothetical protein
MLRWCVPRGRCEVRRGRGRYEVLNKVPSETIPESPLPHGATDGANCKPERAMTSRHSVRLGGNSRALEEAVCRCTRSQRIAP